MVPAHGAAHITLKTPLHLVRALLQILQGLQAAKVARQASPTRWMHTHQAQGDATCSETFRNSAYACVCQSGVLEAVPVPVTPKVKPANASGGLELSFKVFRILVVKRWTAFRLP